MKALIQRVSRAAVTVEGQTVGEIGSGLLVLLGVERGDEVLTAQKMAAKLCNYRVFADRDEKMNLSVSDVKGSVLLVSQFTLAANTDKGLRPSFSRAAEPTEAERLYLLVAEKIREKNIRVATGQFAADMQVELVNDGPVTFLLQE
ncbi:MAG: D-tyrosyl-tRNA(Tyr) deacylase [Gammaproteobacteria bacterium]|nr:D-tyrosyl-tRNA(Tyr) deacylase [Gammaproteobacteria bacterium]MBT8149898.1 D-tyrosyl-tRNA(Tyr) deacylase [Gammaproteobacteria bacterium]NNL11221.1 D-tyrosyl-tRNA(Tyr) deacylase [Pseudomonadales bacterium]NNM11441.1 D-tyrosyl-tRNA(Tyr) deacylase [Pseudomonadales bacterium]RZV57303.1 MAG: D-tyrosyl-tRNA(Tyr) deacylase [Pseudomonadales bacterium]